MSRDPARTNRTRALLAAGFVALALAVAWFATRADGALRDVRGPGATDELQPTRDPVLVSEVEHAAPRAVAREAEQAELDTAAPRPTRSAAVSELQLVSVRVRAIDANGTDPMPGMVVELWNGGKNPLPGDPSVRRERTNGEGIAVFELTRSRGTTLALAARIAQHGWSSSIARVGVSPDIGVPPGVGAPPGDRSRREPVELVLHPVLGCVVHGLVFDGTSARAGSGHVEVHFPGVSEREATETEEPERYPIAPDGTFELRLPSGRAAVLRAVLPHGATGERKLTLGGSTPLIYITLNAYPRGDITGRLVDLAGRPLAGFRIQATQQQTDASAGTFPRGSRHATQTDPDGRFSFEGELSRPTLLESSAPRFSPARRWTLAEDVTPGALQDATYSLPLARIAVSARDDRGEPLEPAHAKSSSSAIAWSSEDSFSGGWVRHAAGTDPTRARVTPGLIEERGWIRELGTLPTAEELGRTVMTYRRGELLVDPDAAPVQQLLFLAEAGHSYSFALRSWGHDYLEEQVWVPDSGEDVTVELRPVSLRESVAVDFVLLAADGEPYPGRSHWVITAWRRSGQDRASFPSTDGGTLRVRLPQGTYTVVGTFRTESGRTAPVWGVTQEISIEPDGPRRFEFHVSDAEERQGQRLLFGR